MKRKDIFVLNWLFASLYFPTSTLLLFFSQEGTLFGVVIIGLVFHAILTVLLTLMWFVEEPKTIIKPARVEIIEPKPKRAYKKKNKNEVKTNEEEKNVEGVEPSPAMRTDVDLNQLDNSDDDQPD
ncbi:hypothetical protein HY485_05180 [Candidatus Woesearchaeota archaeon]|nr:hypothetical protein [Candidatus Woesearchaeota archaeon]